VVVEEAHREDVEHQEEDEVEEPKEAQRQLLYALSQKPCKSQKSDIDRNPIAMQESSLLAERKTCW
jgi:hypothetical protein